MRISRKNILLNEKIEPVSLYERYPAYNFSKSLNVTKSKFDFSIIHDLSKDLLREIFLHKKFFSSELKRLSQFVSFDQNSIYINRLYWGSELIECQIEIAALFWLFSVTSLKKFLPRIISELKEKYPPRKIIYWLRYADILKYEIAKLFPVSNKNIYRWFDDFRKSELIRLKNESIWRYIKEVTYDTNKYYKFVRGEVKIGNYNCNDLANIPHLNGEFKRHVRRTKAEIEADRKKNL